MAIACLMLAPVGCVATYEGENAYDEFGTTGEPVCDDDVRELASPPWVDFDLAGAHTCGLDAKGRVGCPPALDDPSPDYTCVRARAVAVSRRGAPCLALAEGGVQCFGAGTDEAIGAGSFSSALPLDDWIDHSNGQAMPPGGTHLALAATDEATCSVQSDGRVFCWGASFGEAEGQYPLDDVDGGWVDVAVDQARVYGLLADGSVRCRIAASDLPQPAGDRVDLEISGSRARALTSQADVECWGGGAWSFELPGQGA